MNHPGIYVLERTAEPEVEPVTLAQMKLHLRMFDDVTTEDDATSVLVQAGREWAERYTGRALIDQTWRLTIDRTRYSFGDLVRGNALLNGWMSWSWYSGAYIWRSNEVMLRRSPVLAIVSVKTVAEDDTETDVDAGTFQLRDADSRWPKLVAINGGTWLTADRVRITFRAGFADRTGSPGQDETLVPARFRQAIKLWAQAHYDRDPATMDQILKAAENLIEPECTELGFA
jgi:hypothetical protein